MELAVIVDNVTKTYTVPGNKDGVVAVRDVTIAVGSGEFLAIVGPSGCGKSTLLRLLAGLEVPTRGITRVFGEVVVEPRRDVGMMFQDATLLPWETALGNAALGAEILGEPKEKARMRAREQLDQVGLQGFHNALPQHLSGGMKQRVAMVRSLLPNPRVLLLDEPFGMLDALTRERLNVELEGIWRTAGKTVVLVTHSIDEAVFLADRVVVMARSPGRVIAEVPIELPRPRVITMSSRREYIEAATTIRQRLESGRREEETDRESGECGD